MQSATLLPAQRRIDNQRGHGCQVSQLQQVDRNLEVPIKLTDLPLQIAQPRTGPLESLVGADNSNVIPHEPPDLIPVVVNDHELVHVLNIPGLPFRQWNFS